MNSISIVIPCRNEEKFIETTLKSLLDQKGVEKVEILVVDGMSEDRTRDVISSLNSDKIKIFDNPNRTTPYALNIGIKNAKGNYIAIFGAHAIYDENYLSQSIQLFNSLENEVYCVGGPIISIGKTDFGIAASEAMSSSIGVGNAKHRFPDYEGYAEMACFPVFKKETFNKFGLYDESLIRNQDDEFCFRIRLKGAKIFISPKVKAKYYVRDSIRGLYKQYFNYGYWRLAVLKKHKLPIAFRQQVPFLFYSVLLLLLIIGLLIKNIFAAFFLPAIYLLAISLYSLLKVRGSLKIKFYFIAAVLTLHFSYAAGFGKGFYDFFYKVKHKK